MAATTTPPSIELDARAALAAAAGRRVAVACSSGRDSMALLHAAARMAAQEGGEVVALHVHHGLSAQADAWLALVQAQCERWSAQGWPVRLLWRHLALAPEAGDSVEAVAREGRYKALAEMAQEAGCSAVLLAHHRRDQAETFLLQALRGAGVAGLAAMPPVADRHGVTWLRPWLNQPREHIEAYVAQHAVSYVDDDSNTDGRFARNRLRLDVWPALQQAFGDAEQVLAQAASHQADLLACLNDWLGERLPAVTSMIDGPDGLARQALLVSDWSAWADGPRRELLRAWFKQATGRAMPASWVQRLHREVLDGASRRWPLALPAQGKLGRLDGELVLYRGLLTWRDRSNAVGDLRAMVSAAAQAPLRLRIDQPGRVALPAGWGELMVQPVEREGVPLAWLQDCELAPRQGGERFQMAQGRSARSLKKQFQMQGVPAWAREGPLVWANGQLVFVPGLGVDARAWAEPGQAQVQISWKPSAHS
ncbi:MAG: tRNA lysidine(34) synthetase TilS [Aquabacterium sp.]|jgi:tRNA(Ile)-lysidine synthase|uniref:tRNA lysidine(34) synthetase TilS n=1 Tax=Aquabacterium sp. TaxID=1872578 RepID=UPI003BAE3366